MPIGGSGWTGIQARKFRNRTSFAAIQIVHVDVRETGLVRRVIENALVWHPARSGDERAITRDADRIRSIVIRNVNFTFAAALALESDLGARYARLAGDLF